MSQKAATTRGRDHFHVILRVSCIVKHHVNANLEKERFAVNRSLLCFSAPKTGQRFQKIDDGIPTQPLTSKLVACHRHLTKAAGPVHQLGA